MSEGEMNEHKCILSAMGASGVTGTPVECGTMTED